MSNEDSGEIKGHPQPGASVAKVLITNRAIITTLVLFGFVIVRVLIMARGDLPTTLAIISAVGPVTVVVNSIVASTPGILYLAFLALTVLLGLSRDSETWRKVLIVSAILVIFVGMTFVASWFLVILVLVQIGPFIQVRRRPDPSRPWLRSPVPLLIPLGIGLLFVTLAGPAIWLPAEVIQTDNHGQIVGYVMDEHSDWYLILRDNPRGILRIEKSHIKERVVCSTEAQAHDTRSIAMAQVHPDVAGALEILGEPDAPSNFGDLYKVLEIVSKNVTGLPGLKGLPNLKKMGWVPPAQLEAFTASANHQGISGDQARHARMEGTPRPEKMMTLSEARQVIGALGGCWSVSGSSMSC